MLSILIVLVLVLLTVGFIVFIYKLVASSMGDRKTLDTGVPGSAIVMSLDPTGTVINDLYYVCRIGLRVQLPARPSYDVMIKQSVPITAMAFVGAGGNVAVKVDPTDETKVVIDWGGGAR